MKKRFLNILIILLFTGILNPPMADRGAFAQQDVPSEAEEYALKAVFLYNFSRYIDWLPSTMDEEFTIGVLGTSPILAPLKEIAASKTLKGKKIIIKQFNKPEDIHFTHILFISKKSAYPLEDVLAKVSKGTLTVSERDGSLQEGVAFNFIITENKLKFEASQKTITNAGLKASSELLKLAIIN